MRIKVDRFMAYKNPVEVEIPDVGMTVVTGRNGCGKSTLFVEAVAFGLYGQTTRGTPPRVGDSVTVEIGDLWVERVKKAREVGVKWRVGGSKQATAEGATKAQGRINTHVGMTFPTWCQTSIVNVEKSVKFSTAKDSDRKALLEQVLGLERFDGALKLVRAEKSTASARQRELGVAVAGHTKVVTQASEVLELHRSRVPSAPSKADVKKTLARRQQLVDDLLPEAKKLVASTEAAMAAANEARVDAEATSRAASLELVRARRANEAKVCPACRRPLEDGDEHKTDTAPLEKLDAEAAAALTDAMDAARKASTAWRDASASAQALELELRDVHADLRAAKAASEAVKSHADAEVELLDRLNASKAELDKAASDLAAATAELDVLLGAEAVLGLRGARARLVGSGLDLLTAGANQALSVMGADARVEVKPEKTNKNGDVVDCVDIEVDPWGDGDGYDGCSGGERKRLDLALITGAVALRPAKSGMPVVFDDVFDTLDTDGIDSVVALLKHLSQTMPVIVITQNVDLAGRLPAARRFDL